MEEAGGISWTYQKPLIPSGKLPGGRNGASLIWADGKLVTFGGTYFEGDDKFTYLDETWLLDTDKLVWHKMQCSGEIPPPSIWTLSSSARITYVYFWRQRSSGCQLQGCILPRLD